MRYKLHGRMQQQHAGADVNYTKRDGGGTTSSQAKPNGTSYHIIKSGRGGQIVSLPGPYKLQGVETDAHYAKATRGCRQKPA
jgi:hypothetical protein